MTEEELKLRGFTEIPSQSGHFENSELRCLLIRNGTGYIPYYRVCKTENSTKGIPGIQITDAKELDEVVQFAINFQRKINDPMNIVNLGKEHANLNP